VSEKRDSQTGWATKECSRGTLSAGPLALSDRVPRGNELIVRDAMFAPASEHGGGKHHRAGRGDGSELTARCRAVARVLAKSIRSRVKRFIKVHVIGNRIDWSGHDPGFSPSHDSMFSHRVQLRSARKPRYSSKGAEGPFQDTSQPR